MRPPKRQPPPDFATNSDCCPHPPSSTDDCHLQSKVAASLTRFSSLFHPRHGIRNPPAETCPAFFLCKSMKYYASTLKNPRGNISHKRIPTHLNEYCCFPLQWITPCPCPPRTLPGATILAHHKSSRSITRWRAQREVVSKWPRLLHHPHDGGMIEQTGAIGTQTAIASRDIVGPVGVEERGCGGAIGQREVCAGNPVASFQPLIEPGVDLIEQLAGLRYTIAVAIRDRAQRIQHHFFASASSHSCRRRDPAYAPPDPHRWAGSG